MYHFQVFEPGRPPRELSTGATAGTIKLGRAPSCQIRVEGEGISRMHAAIAIETEPIRLIDMGSSVGTRLNGAPVTVAPLAAGDTIELGDVRVVFTAVWPLPDPFGRAAALPNERMLWDRPVPPALRALVLDRAAQLGLPARVLDALRAARCECALGEYWRVETRVWWERRLFRLHGAVETGMDLAYYCFGSLLVDRGELPDRWALAHEPSRPFEPAEHRFLIRKEGDPVELDVRFGTDVVTHTLGDVLWPTSLAHALPVDARYQGADCAPVVAPRAAGVYREAAQSLDHAGVPPAVMDRVRALVRDIDLPGYSERLHLWRTHVRGGYVSRLRFRVELPSRGEVLLEALGLEDARVIYAPDLADLLPAG